MRRSALLLAAIIATVLAADQVTKSLVRASIPFGRSIPILGGIAYLTHATNTGAAFSLLEGLPWLFATISTVVVIAALIWWYVTQPKALAIVVGLGLLVGGAAGNLVDRVTRGYVTDFLDVRIWPVFNVADSAVFLGVGLIALSILLTPERADDRSGSEGTPTEVR